MQAESKSVTKRTGLKKFLHDIVHRRHRFRQFLGIAILILLTIVGAPTHRPMFIVGAILAVLGVIVRLWASGHVKKDKVLATTGPYAYVRHPLYVGNHLLMFGFCLASGWWWSFILFVAFNLYFYPQTIRHEDQLLARLFPGQWEAWNKQTRALIPRLTPYQSGQTSEWSFTQSLRKNGEPIIAALLVWCLYLLYMRLPA
ncbi:MAG: isoprenylcysteine carboxylmethyltransferase family protein [Gammaproteobacteria bacterium]|nr:isoprenylcysteine carboxylmethyltransferase family protein [Gammaproteobacteria bacterium]